MCFLKTHLSLILFIFSKIFYLSNSVPGTEGGVALYVCNMLLLQSAWLHSNTKWIPMATEKCQKESKGPLQTWLYCILHLLFSVWLHASIVQLWCQNFSVNVTVLHCTKPLVTLVDSLLTLTVIKPWADWLSHNGPFSQQTFWLVIVGKAQLKLITLMMAQFHQVSQ